MSEQIVISATRRAMKEMADGTIRVSIDIDPQYREAFLTHFSAIDSPVAIAPLVSDFERAVEAGNSVPEASKEDVYTGLTKLAIDWCKDEQFADWIIQDGYEDLVVEITHGTDLSKSEFSKQYILRTCCIESRKELNTDPHAAAAFQQFIRAPYMVWLNKKGLGQI